MHINHNGKVAQFENDYGEKKTLRKTRHGWTIQRGASTIPLGTLYAIAAALEVQPTDLLPSLSEVLKDAGVKMKQIGMGLST